MSRRSEIPLTPQVIENFWARVTPRGPDECWPWGGCLRKGYGILSLNKYQRRLAHRVSYEIANGQGSALSHDIDHRCRHSNCVNPRHLRKATKKENKENISGAQRNNKAGIRGVRQIKSGTWMARVTHKRTVFYLGTFPTKEEANAAAVAKRNELFTHNEADRCPER